jgi:glycosyltransferase involved in cell wall biosynthesis
MLLSDLNSYKKTFLQKGIEYPLQKVKTDIGGLLGELPKPVSNVSGWPWSIETDPKLYSNNIEWPKLTIVTPSFNQGQYIEETIRSVLLQNYPNLEYIVIDGGSTDSTKEILEKYSPWISYWQSEKDNGQSNAINLGFSLASGNYYAWINSDDYYNEKTFLTLANHIIKERNKTFFYGWAKTIEVIDGEKIFKDHKPRHQFKRHIRVPSLLQPSCFWHESIHEPIWEDLICSMDYEFWVRIFPKSKPHYIKKFLSVALIHDEAKTYNETFKKDWDNDHKKITERHGGFTALSWKIILIELRILRFFSILLRK